MRDTLPNSVLKIIGPVTQRETKMSNITSGWARNSNWDGRMCARDLFQNFFDAATESNLKVSDIQDNLSEEDLFHYYIPEAIFDINRLYYLGSEKDGVNSVGQVGEGFKLASLTLLRDFKVRIFAASGDSMVEIKLASKRVAEDINLAPMQYDFYDLSTPVNGNYLFIEGANKALVSALQSARYEFYYPEHPSMGKRLFLSSLAKGVELYERSDLTFGSYTDTKQGLIFYHNQLRAVINDANVVLVISKRWKSIDSKIGQDRDRTFFGDKLKAALLRLSLQNALYSRDENAMCEILELSKHSLPHGNSFLSALAEYGCSYYSDETKFFEYKEKLRKQYLGNVYGQLPHHGSTELIIKERELKASGFIGVPRYMEFFGAVSLWRLIEEQQQQQAEEVRASGSRQPTRHEMEIIKLAYRFVPSTVELNSFEFHVFESKYLLGEFKQNHVRSLYERTHLIYLSQELFTSTPGDIISTVLHETAHSFGYDGSREFTDALTKIIGLIIDKNSDCTKVFEMISTLVDKVKTERNVNGRSLHVLNGILARKNPDEMATLLSKIPVETILDLI